MIFFIYAVIGMQLFGQISIKEEPGFEVKKLLDDDPVRSERQNGSETLTSGRKHDQCDKSCSTGEAWQDIMLACTAGRACAEGSDEKGTKSCGSNLAYLYFISFHAISAFLVFSNGGMRRAGRNAGKSPARVSDADI
ncbi:hypothetical protein X801_07526 [Opisthorchis viverrini]|uniref:Ion transport domain-containing protein n=1 Tax=Opisthorchis viverrini TaxID=6198 RepID=A0A1S8WQD1_OPIVI|nr:hypothetical protein X801_07526 [Opisthorchis viverrini]